MSPSDGKLLGFALKFITALEQCLQWPLIQLLWKPHFRMVWTALLPIFQGMKIRLHQHSKGAENNLLL